MKSRMPEAQLVHTDGNYAAVTFVNPDAPAPVVEGTKSLAYETRFKITGVNLEQ